MAGLRGSMLGFRSKFALLSVGWCVCLSTFVPVASAQRGGVRKPSAKKQDAQKQDPSPVPAYTPSPLQPLPLDQLPAVAPKVTYERGQLTVVAHNCTLADVLRAIKKQIGADVDIPPSATERVVADLGPAGPRQVIADLLNGTHFNYVMVGSASDPSVVQSLALTPKSGGGTETASANPPNRPGVPARVFQPGMPPSGQGTTPPDAAQADADDNSDPPEEATDQNDGQEDQQAQQPADQQNPGQQAPKTPEQLLQELQRQQQLQQQQQGQQPGQSTPPPQGGLIPNQPPTTAPPSKPD